MDLILKYFPGLSVRQQDQFRQLKPLFEEWNAQINVISRKDIDQFYERHVLHSLAIAKVYAFKPGQKILDVGTGGGFPGLPLAILCPNTQFLLVDSIAKKIKVVNEVAAALDLQNVTGLHERAENVLGVFDFIVSRAVTQMPKFLTWTKGKIKPSKSANKGELKNGILYLKGGDLTQELKGIKHRGYEIADFFEEPFFETKKVIYVSGTYK